MVRGELDAAVEDINEADIKGPEKIDGDDEGGTMQMAAPVRGPTPGPTPAESQQAPSDTRRPGVIWGGGRCGGGYK